MKRLLALFSLVFTSTVAHGQTLMCPEDYDAAAFTSTIDALETALASYELATAKQHNKAAMQYAPCLRTIANPRELSRLGRATALLAFLGQDEDVAMQWVIFAKVTAPDAAAPASADIPYAFTEFYASTEPTPLGRAMGQSFAPPKGGAIYQNGQLALTPETHSEVPVFTQVFDQKQRVVDAYWQNGAAYNPRWLVEGPMGYTAPKWTQAPQTMVARPPKAPKTNNGQLVRIGTAAGLAVAAGSLYLGAAVTAGRLDDATTEDELRSIRSSANLLTLGAVLTGSAAVSVGVTILVTDTKGVGLNIRF